MKSDSVEMKPEPVAIEPDVVEIKPDPALLKLQGTEEKTIKPKMSEMEEMTWAVNALRNLNSSKSEEKEEEANMDGPKHSKKKRKALRNQEEKLMEWALRTLERTQYLSDSEDEEGKPKKQIPSKAGQHHEREPAQNPEVVCKRVSVVLKRLTEKEIQKWTQPPIKRRRNAGVKHNKLNGLTQVTASSGVPYARIKVKSAEQLFSTVPTVKQSRPEHLPVLYSRSSAGEPSHPFRKLNTNTSYYSATTFPMPHPLHSSSMTDFLPTYGVCNGINSNRPVNISIDTNRIAHATTVIVPNPGHVSSMPKFVSTNGVCNGTNTNQPVNISIVTNRTGCGTTFSAPNPHHRSSKSEFVSTYGVCNGANTNRAVNISINTNRIAHGTTVSVPNPPHSSSMTDFVSTYGVYNGTNTNRPVNISIETNRIAHGTTVSVPNPHHSSSMTDFVSTYGVYNGTNTNQPVNISSETNRTACRTTFSAPNPYHSSSKSEFVSTYGVYNGTNSNRPVNISSQVNRTACGTTFSAPNPHHGTSTSQFVSTKDVYNGTNSNQPVNVSTESNRTAYPPTAITTRQSYAAPNVNLSSFSNYSSSTSATLPSLSGFVNTQMYSSSPPIRTDTSLKECVSPGSSYITQQNPPATVVSRSIQKHPMSGSTKPLDLSSGRGGALYFPEKYSRYCSVSASCGSSSVPEPRGTTPQAYASANSNHCEQRVLPSKQRNSPNYRMFPEFTNLAHLISNSSTLGQPSSPNYMYSPVWHQGSVASANVNLLPPAAHTNGTTQSPRLRNISGCPLPKFTYFSNS